MDLESTIKSRGMIMNSLSRWAISPFVVFAMSFLGCAGEHAGFGVDGVYLGMRRAEVEQAHAGQFAFRRIRLDGAEIEIGKRSAGPWQQFNVTLMENVVSGITAIQDGADSATWARMRETLKQEFGQPRSTTRRSDVSGARSEVLIWGSATPDDVDKSKYVQITPLVNANGPYLLASLAWSSSSGGFLSIEAGTGRRRTR